MDGWNSDKPDSCPSQETLAALLQLKSDDDVAVRLRGHLQSCTECQTRLDALTDAPDLAAYKRNLRSELAAGNDAERKMIASIAERVSIDIASSLNEFDDGESDVVGVDAANLETFANSATEIGDDYDVKVQPATEKALPRTIGRYSILSELGRGGAGVVYLAFDPEINRKLALKQIHSCHAGQQKRLVQEAQAAARLQTDEVVRIYGIESDSHQNPFITMEYIDGVTLSREIKKRGYLPADRASEICRTIARGVQSAHELGILHRDIKPGNILLTKNGGAKLADFGLAHLGEASAELTRTGVLIGTPAYMSPEQASGKTLDPRSDVYSLGCVLYEALTGSMPFYGTSHQVLRQIVDDDPVAVRRLNENVSRDLEAICNKAMAKNPDRRYQSAALLGADLAAWENGDPISARPETQWQKAGRWYSRNKTFAWMGSIILAMLLATTVGSLVFAQKIAKENQKTKIASEQAEEAAAVAAEQRELALKTLNELIFNVQNQLKDRPGTLEVRNEILQSALGGLKEIVSDSEALPVEHSSIVAHIRIGEIEMAKGADDRAIEHFQAARQIAEGFLENEPDNPDALADLAGALIALGDIRRGKFDNQGALEFYQPAAAARQHLVAVDSDVRNEVEYVRVLVRLGTAKSGLGDDDSATKDLLEAVDRMDRILNENRDDKGYLRTLAITLSSTVNHLIKVGDLSKAIELVDRIRAVNSELLQEDEYNVDYLLDAAISFSQLAHIHAQQLQWEKAVEYAQESRKIHQRIVASNPDNSWSRSNLGLQWHIEAMVWLALGDLENAREAWRENLNIHREISAADPGNSRFAVPMAESLMFLASVAIRQSELESAVELLEESAEVYGRISAVDLEKNPLMKQASDDCVILRDALAIAVQIGELPDSESIANSTDVEKLAFAFLVYRSVDGPDKQRASEVAALLADADVSDETKNVHFRFCLMAALAKLLSVADEDSVEMDRGEISLQASLQMERYLACRPNLLLNVLADPDLAEFRKTDEFQAAMRRIQGN